MPPSESTPPGSQPDPLPSASPSSSRSRADDPPEPTGPQPSADLVRRLGSLCDTGRYLQAYELIRGLAPPQSWEGADARVVAARLVTELGAPRLASVLLALAHREDRGHPRALFFYAGVVARRFGPLAEWRFLQRHGELPDARDDSRADWLGNHATVLATLRDFERADEYMRRALELQPENPWIACQQADMLEEADRRKEALAAVKRALEIRPFYRPAVQRAAHLLQQQNHGARALDLLRRAAHELESSHVVRQLVASLFEEKQYAEASRELERLPGLTPLAERDFEQYLNAQRCDIAYQQGDLEAAGRYAADAGEGFFAVMAERLAAGDAQPRIVRLPVEFVKQNFVTCAPATLAAIAAYWSRDVDHEALAAEICYDGTADHVERNWAERNGFIAPEFRVTWETAQALLDRGIPFTVATGGATWGHIQAVIGYDDLRRTFQVMEPSSYMTCEYLAEEWLERHASLGPRGMLLLPREESSRLNGIALPERELYQRFYRIKRALHDHDRPTAAEECRALMNQAPNHRLALQARWSIADYDSDPEMGLQCVDALLEIHPRDARLENCKAVLLRSLAHREELWSFLEELAFRPGADPIFKLQYAEESRQDARNAWEADWLVRHVLRAYREEASVYAHLASQRAARGAVAEALELYRFAACLGPTDEGYARGYFQIAQLCGRTDEAVAFLERRTRELGNRSGAPACTLYDCLSSLARNREAFAALRQAMKHRPDDMQLVLFTAQAVANYGKIDNALRLLDRAKNRAKRADWMRVRAQVARIQGDPRTALTIGLELAERQPYDVDLQWTALDLLEQLEGPEQVVSHIQRMMERTPHYLPVQRLGVERLGRHDPAAAIAALEQLLQRHKTFAWGYRELALLLAGESRVEEARRYSETALALDPDTAASHGIHAQVLASLGDRDAAREAYEQSVRLDPDYGAGIEALVALAVNREERLAALDFVAQQLASQVVYGDGLVSYRRAARSVVDAEHVLPLLRRTLADRPELGAAWRETTTQLVEMNQLGEALEIATQATERFPLVAEMWYELAQVHHARREVEGRLAALERATTLDPTSYRGLCDLAEAYQSADRLDDAEAVLRRVIAQAPRSSAAYGFLADVRRAAGDVEAGLEELERALRLDARYAWAWHQHEAWSTELDRPGATAEFARALAVERSEDPHVWLALAARVPEDALEERLAAAERAVALAPLLCDAHTAKIAALGALGRFDEAIAACDPAVFAGRPPTELRGHAAWLLAERGERARAIEHMREVVEAETHFLWGWQMLCSWYREEGDYAGVEATCAWLTRLDPLSSYGWSNLAECQLFLGKRAEARESLERAVELEPDYGWASFNLFDLQMESEDFARAEALLKSVHTHVGGDVPLALEVALALKRGDAERAETRFTALCELEAVSETALSRACDAFREAGADPGPLLQRVLDRGAASPPAALHRAAMCANQGDVAGQIAALEYARERAPEDDHVARGLADAYQRAGRTDDARRILDAILERRPDDAYSLAYLADLQWVTDEPEIAIATMTRALVHEPDIPWCWQALEGWAEWRSDPDLVRTTARAVARARPQDARCWLHWARRCRVGPETEERLEAVRGAIAAAPFDPEAHDLHVVSLAEAGKLDEAEAACRPEVYGDDRPQQLVARAAWLHDARGDRTRAVGEMVAVTESTPRNFFAWECLDDWYLESEAHEERLSNARRFAARFPQHSEALRRLGNAQLGLADVLREAGDRRGVELREEAKESHARAAALEPGSPPAFCDAFDLLFADGELERAGRLLDAYLARTREDFGLARAVQYYCATQQRDAALGAFAELIGLSDDAPWPVPAAWEALVEKGWHKRGQKQLREAVASGAIHTQAARLFARQCARKRHGRRHRRQLIGLFQAGQLGVEAAIAYLDEAPAGAEPHRIRRACGDLFQRDPRLWAAWGELLMRHLRDREVRKWMKDWRDRVGVGSWALGTLHASLRRLDRGPEAAAVADAGLQRCGPGEGDHFRIWLAYDQVLAGESTAAREALEPVDREQCNAYYTALLQVVEACIAVAGERDPGYALAKQRMSEALPAVASYHRSKIVCISRAYFRALRFIARSRGGVAPWLWWAWMRQRVFG